MIDPDERVLRDRTVPLWRIRLFGTLCVFDAANVLPPVVQFRTQREAALLAYLAFYSKRQHSREELAELLWPECDPVRARSRLRQELATLRRQLEPGPRFTPGSVIETIGRQLVGLKSGAMRSDLEEFEELLRSSQSQTGQERQAALEQAVVLHGSQGLLAGRYEAWISDERDRLAEIYAQCLSELSRLTKLTPDSRRAGPVGFAFRTFSAAPVGSAAKQTLAAPQPAANESAERAQSQSDPPDVQGAVPGIGDRKLDAGQASATAHETAAWPSGAERQLPSKEWSAAGLTGADSRSYAAPHLPRPLTRFFGRERELDELLALIDSSAVSRLITLTGPGGSGKTRLAVELAHLVQNSVATDPFIVAGFVPLAAVTDASRLTENAAAALFPKLPASGDEMTLDSLADMLTRRRRALAADIPKCSTLVILDNFEQIAEAGASWVRDLLEKAPSLIVVVTSRQSLRLDGEREYPVAPLPLPEHEAEPTVKVIVNAASAALFADRAALARPDFRITKRNAADVGDVCRMLDGIPLALEIAAARIAQLGPSRMRKELASDLFGVLVSRRRDAEDRHRTLRATIAWSVGLLPDDVQRFFARLAVFHDGWTAEASEAVAGADAPGQTAERLQLLQDHSLITSETDSFTGDTRFRLLETLRAFAADQLTPEQQKAAQKDHLAFYVRLAWESDEELKGPNQFICRHRLFLEKSNLRAAFASTDGSADEPIVRARLAAGLVEFWRVEDIVEGTRWMEEALQIADLPPRVRGRLLVSRGQFASASGNIAERDAAFAEALELFRAAEDDDATIDLLVNWSDNQQAVKEGLALSLQFGKPRLQAIALLYQATEKAYRGFRKEAIEGFQNARHLFAECKDLIGFQGILVEESYHRARWGDLSIAAALLEDWLRIAAAAPCGERSSTTVKFRLANIRRLQGRYDVALELLARAEAVARSYCWNNILADVHLCRARLYIDLEQIESARAFALERDRLLSQPLAVHSDGQGCIVYAQIHFAEGDFAAAERKAIEAICAFGDNPYLGWRAVARILLGHSEIKLGDIRAAKGALNEAVRDAAAAGNRRVVAEAIEAVAHAAVATQSFKFAAFLIAFSAAERETMGIVLSPAALPYHESAMRQIRVAIGESEFESAWARGSRTKIDCILRHLKIHERPKP